MKTKLPYLFERNGSYFFRRRVPERFRDRAGCREWKFRLGTNASDNTALLMELRVLSEATDKAVALMLRGGTPAKDFLQVAWETLYPELRAAAVPTVTEASNVYTKVRGLGALDKPEQVALEQFIAFAGDIKLEAISRQRVREWITWLSTERGQGAATIKRRLSSMSGFCSVTIDQQELDLPNPFARHRVPHTSEGYREPFSRAHLKRIQIWLNSGAGSRPSGLIVRLLRSTGARPLEIGGLAVADIRLDERTPYLLIRPNACRRLKTAGSRRMLPLVGDALNAARIAVECRKGEALFPETCHRTGSLSARLNKSIRSAGIPKCRELTAYSFRHTVQEAMRVSGISFEVQRAVLGHAKTSVTERYGAKHVPLDRLASAMEAVALALGTKE